MEAILQLKTELKGAEARKQHLENQLLYLKKCIKTLQRELEHRIH